MKGRIGHTVTQQIGRKTNQKSQTLPNKKISQGFATQPLKHLKLPTLLEATDSSLHDREKENDSSRLNVKPKKNKFILGEGSLKNSFIENETATRESTLQGTQASELSKQFKGYPQNRMQAELAFQRNESQMEAENERSNPFEYCLAKGNASNYELDEEILEITTDLLALRNDLQESSERVRKHELSLQQLHEKYQREQANLTNILHKIEQTANPSRLKESGNSRLRVRNL